MEEYNVFNRHMYLLYVHESHCSLYSCLYISLPCIITDLKAVHHVCMTCTQSCYVDIQLVSWEYNTI